MKYVCYALPTAVTSLVSTTMVTSLDNGLLRTSAVCATVFSMALYVALSNATVATTECNYAYIHLNQ